MFTFNEKQAAVYQGDNGPIRVYRGDNLVGGWETDRRELRLSTMYYDADSGSGVQKSYAQFLRTYPNDTAITIFLTPDEINWSVGGALKYSFALLPGCRKPEADDRRCTVTLTPTTETPPEEIVLDFGLYARTGDFGLDCCTAEVTGAENVKTFEGETVFLLENSHFYPSRSGGDVSMRESMEKKEFFFNGSHYHYGETCNRHEAGKGSIPVRSEWLSKIYLE